MSSPSDAALREAVAKAIMFPEPEDIDKLLALIQSEKQQLLAAILASLPENRKGSPRLLPCPDGKQGCLVAHYGKDIIKTEREHGYNDCLKDVTAVLESYQKQGKGGE